MRVSDRLPSCYKKDVYYYSAEWAAGYDLWLASNRDRKAFKWPTRKSVGMVGMAVAIAREAGYTVTHADA